MMIQLILNFRGNKRNFITSTRLILNMSKQIVRISTLLTKKSPVIGPMSLVQTIVVMVIIAASLIANVTWLVSFSNSYSKA